MKAEEFQVELVYGTIEVEAGLFFHEDGRVEGMGRRIERNRAGEVVLVTPWERNGIALVYS